jgi:hypothetical protein
MLKPVGTKRLKLECDILLSNSAFKFNLGCYNLAVVPAMAAAAGAYTGFHFSST